MIDFISASEGKIQLWEDDMIVAEACTAKSIAYFLQEHGFDGNVYASSSMDFASEEGFETDQCANDLWEKSVNLYYAVQH